MSDPADRRNAPKAWHRDQTALVLRLIDDNRRIAEIMAECQRRYGGVAALGRERARFWATSLRALEPLPDQQHDTAINTDGVTITKRSNQPMRFYGRTSEIERQRWGTRIRCALNCRQASPAALTKAFGKLARQQLRQMQNPDLKAAGAVIGADVNADGTVDLVCMVTDPVAQTKVAQRAYTGVVASLDGNDVADISLVDNPAGFIEKAASRVLCKIYDGSAKLKRKKLKMARRVAQQAGVPLADALAAVESVRKQSVVLPPSAQRVADEAQRIDALAASGRADQLVVKALAHRNNQQLGVELVKAAQRRPTAYGDGIVGFLRHGRP